MRTDSLSSLCTLIVRGISPKYTETGNGVMVLNQKCIRDHALSYAHARFHDIDVKPVNPDKYLQDGDALINSTGHGTLGRTTLVRNIGQDMIVDSHITIVRPDKTILYPPYFGYIIRKLESEFISLATGTSGQTELPRALLQNLKITFVESQEKQRRIVKELDSALEKIEQAIELTKSNYKNSVALFELYRDEAFDSIDKGYVKKLDEVCEKVEYGSSAKSERRGKVPVIRMGNIQQGRIDWDNLVYSNSDEEIEKYRLNYDDVLFNRTNSPELVGKAAVYKGETEALFAGYLIRIHRNTHLLDADYLNYYLNGTAAKNYGVSVMSKSINQANINGTKLKSYPIPVPPLKDQKIIVAKLNHIRQASDELQKAYSKKLSDLAKLKVLLLNRVFEDIL
jgi:type I restriction enzyme, S subunit